METTKHTLNAWLNKKGTIYTNDKHESLIAEVFDRHKDYKANARLIAYAPMLLDTLEFLLKNTVFKTITGY